MKIRMGRVNGTSSRAAVEKYELDGQEQEVNIGVGAAVRFAESERQFDIVVVIRVAAFGGTERHTISMIRHLAETRLRVLIIESGEKVVSEALDGIGGNVYFVHTSLPIINTSTRELDGWVRILTAANAPRVVLVKAWYYAASLGFMRLLHKRFEKVIQIEHTTVAPRRKWSIDIHVSRGIHPGIWWYREQYRLWRLSRVAGAVITVSEFNRRCLIDNAFVDSRKIAVCANGVDTEFWRRDQLAGQKFRAELGIPGDAFVFCCAGRLAPEKGYELAVDAFNLLKGMCVRNDAYLCIVGEGAERGQLETRALPNWRFIKFAGFRQDMVSVYSGVDVLLVPTHHKEYWSGESFGLSLAEAMSCECSVLATAHGALPEVLGEQFSACLIAERCAESWASAMATQLSNSSGARAVIGRELRHRIVERFEEKVRMQELIGEILS